MFEMKFVLDESRMIRDGLNPEEKWSEIDEIIKRAGKCEVVHRGLIQTESLGIRSWIADKLEKKDWFMKYVCKWEIADERRRDNAIEIYNRLGIRCCYE